jgi:arylsulfatase A-like enzyme
MNVVIKRRVSGQSIATCLVLAIIAAAAGNVACRLEPRPKNIVLICVDTLRSDHLGGYGYDRSTTPNLDSLAAEEGITFENAYASSSWTLPSVTSVFTSLHAPQHGVEDQGTRLSEDATTLSERLSVDDWLTAAFVTHIYVSSLFGLDQGFSEFHELSIDWNFREGLQLRADQLNQNVLPWLEHHSDSRFFLYLHYFDPHWEYDPPGPYRARFTDPDYLGPADGTWEHLSPYLSPERLMAAEDLRQTEGLYDGEILWTDHHLGLLFDAMKALGLWDQSLIVIFGDHGEEFQEHGSVHHTKTLYEEVLRVPLLIKLPGGRPPDARPRVDERVRLMDIAPTILEVAGLDPSPEMGGTSLLSSLEKRGDDRDVFAHTRRNEANKMALLTGDWKFIFTYTPGRESVELFDLARDPLERASVSRFQRDLAKKLWQDAESRFQTMLRWNHEHLAPANPVELTPEQEEHLRTLGYVE